MKINPYLFPVVLFLFIMTGCKTDAETPSPELSFDGEALFKGIMLLEGEAANKIPLFSTFKSKHDFDNVLDIQATRREINYKIVDQIKLSDPTFFASFQKGITSGNHYLVRETVARASNMIAEALKEIPETGDAISDVEAVAMSMKRGDELNSKEIRQKRIKELFTKNNLSQYIVVETYLVVIWPTLVYIYFGPYTDVALEQELAGLNNSSSDLKNEILIEQIVKAFKN